MSPFVSKGMNSCARDTVFSWLMLTVSLFGREGEESSGQYFTCGVQMETVGKGGMRMCWLVAERGACFIACQVFGSAVWVCNFMGFPFLQQTFKQ